MATGVYHLLAHDLHDVVNLFCFLESAKVASGQSFR